MARPAAGPAGSIDQVVRRGHRDHEPEHGPSRGFDLDQALCLTLVTNAAVLWTTTYRGDALNPLRVDGYPLNDKNEAHLTPAQHDHINFYGTYSFDLETELRREGHRPLRSSAA